MKNNSLMTDQVVFYFLAQERDEKERMRSIRDEVKKLLLSNENIQYHIFYSIETIRVGIQKGDVLVISSLDRMGKDVFEIYKELKHIQDIGASIWVLDMIPYDTVSEIARVASDEWKLISDLTVKTFLYVVEKEKAQNRERQRSGIEKAKEAKKYKGRKPKAFDEESFRLECEKWHNGEQTAAKTYRNCGLSKTYFYAKIRELGLSKQKNEKS